MHNFTVFSIHAQAHLTTQEVSSSAGECIGLPGTSVTATGVAASVFDYRTTT